MNDLPAQPGAQPADPARPQMTERDKNFQIHLAGMRAGEQAEKLGLSPEQADALLDAAAGGRVIGTIKFPPISASLLLLLPQLDAFKATMPDLASDAIGLMAIAHCVLDPDAARTAIRAKNVTAFEAALFEISRQLTLTQLKELGEWIAEQMKLLNGGEEAPAEATEKKSEPAAPAQT